MHYACTSDVYFKTYKLCSTCYARNLKNMDISNRIVNQIFYNNPLCFVFIFYTLVSKLKFFFNFIQTILLFKCWDLLLQLNPDPLDLVLYCIRNDREQALTFHNACHLLPF